MSYRLIWIFLIVIILPGIMSSQTVSWSKRAGGPDFDFANSIATDVSGTSSVVGYFRSPTIRFDTTVLSNVGSFDMFIARYDPDGSVAWARRAGGPGSDVARSVAVDAAGYSVVVGEFFSASISFDTLTLTASGGGDLFVARYGPDGSVHWAKGVGGSGTDIAWGVSLDETGNIYVTGSFTSPSLIFGTDTLMNAGGEDIFIVKYDPDGNVVWATGDGGTGNDAARDIVTDAAGASHVVGYFGSIRIRFGTTTLLNAGGTDMFIATYDADGIIVRARGAGGTDSDLASGVAVDTSGNSYVVGNYRSARISFDAFGLMNVFTGESDMYIVKYDPDGNALWARRLGGTLGNSAPSIAVDSVSNSYVTGQFRNSWLTSQAGVAASEDISDIWVHKYDPGGSIAWTENAGGSTGDDPQEIALDHGGNIYVTGFFQSLIIELGGDMLFNAGATDMFMVKFRDELTAVIPTDDGIPALYELSRNYPNPFNPVTRFQYSLPVTSHVRVRVSNLLGEIVTTLMDDIQTPGVHAATWDASGLPSGVYIYSLRAGSFSDANKMLLLK